MARPAPVRVMESLRTRTLAGWAAHPLQCTICAAVTISFGIAGLGSIVLGEPGPPIRLVCWLFGCN